MYPNKFIVTDIRCNGVVMSLYCSNAGHGKFVVTHLFRFWKQSPTPPLAAQHYSILFREIQKSSKKHIRDALKYRADSELDSNIFGICRFRASIINILWGFFYINRLSYHSSQRWSENLYRNRTTNENKIPMKNRSGLGERVSDVLL